MIIKIQSQVWGVKLCMLGSFACFFVVWYSVESDLDQHCLQRLSADNKSCHLQNFSKECVPQNFFYFPTKVYVLGTQKNRLSKTVLLSTQNIC